MIYYLQKINVVKMKKEEKKIFSRAAVVSAHFPSLPIYFAQHFILHQQ